MAATGVMANQFILAGALDVAMGLWIFGILLWIILTYTIFANLTIMEVKPTIDQGITGAWLLAVVSTQAIALLSALLARHIHQPLRLDRQFSGAFDVAVGRHDVHLDHLADFLSLHVFQVLAGRFRALILDQHGSDGDLDARRLGAD